MNSYDMYRKERGGKTWHKIGFTKAGKASAAVRQFSGERQGGSLRAKLVSKGNPGVSVKSVRVKNFTGTITKMPNGTVRVSGKAKK